MVQYIRINFFILLLSVEPALAQELLGPAPDLSPEQVVDIQLTALQSNDSPFPDTGIAQNWAFAHPNNKAVTGPLDRFATMIKGPSYRMLIDHHEHLIQSVVQSDDYAMFAITITTRTGQRVAYRWEMSKILTGEFTGSWMTTGVSAPLRPADGT